MIKRLNEEPREYCLNANLAMATVKELESAVDYLARERIRSRLGVQLNMVRFDHTISPPLPPICEVGSLLL